MISACRVLQRTTRPWHRRISVQRILQTHSSKTSSAMSQPYNGVAFKDLPKTWNFTSKLPPDPAFPTPADSHKTPRDRISPRQVRGALFTWVRPEPSEQTELLAVSPAAMRDLGIRRGEEDSDEFQKTVAGNMLQGWDEDKLEGGYPWAQCYGGFQFGQWAGQLGDGRAISLFETTNPASGVRYELQLKGAGLTPYSRFADGKAVLRSSIREFVVSEALHAMGIPSTRALSLTLVPHEKVIREKIEPKAMVLRFAQSWIRLGNFDILRARGDRALTRQLATYVAEDVFGGWDTLPARLDRPGDAADSPPPGRGVPMFEVQGPAEMAENRFVRLYREVVRRNAETVAKWQAYGFMNGVLNTDNTSICGLSIDFGPFAFMDTFDPAYTPNHDDYALRYSYRNQPTIIWWNLVRLGEALGELMGIGDKVDDEGFITDGVDKDKEKEVAERAEKIIMQIGEEYKAVFLAEYRRLMTARLGLKTFKEGDFEELYSGLLNMLEALSLDFNHFFRRLGGLMLGEIATEEARKDAAGVFFQSEGPPKIPGEDEARERIAAWMDKWRRRALEDWGGQDKEDERLAAMRGVNPNFVPRGWILAEIISAVEERGDVDMLRRAMRMATHPFEETWHGRKLEEEEGGEDDKEWVGDVGEEWRWTGDVPTGKLSMQCSCSS